MNAVELVAGAIHIDHPARKGRVIGNGPDGLGLRVGRALGNVLPERIIGRRQTGAGKARAGDQQE